MCSPSPAPGPALPQDTGAVTETGAGGTNINVPLHAGSGNGAYLAAIERVAVPAVTAFAPDIIFVSSGFDPSPVDPLGCMTVTSGGFKDMAARLVTLAEHVCGGKIVFSHEGGYCRCTCRSVGWRCWKH